MKRKLTVKDFAVGDVVSAKGYLEVVVGIRPSDGLSLITRSLEGIDGEQSWYPSTATILASPLALAKRYWGYEERDEQD